MQLYGIRRRQGWATPDELQATAPVSAQIGDLPGSGVRWIRSYAVQEADGALGTFCLYEAESPEAVRAHAHAVGMPADEITPVAETLVVRPDPVAATG
jgi:hypothetical protein